MNTTPDPDAELPDWARGPFMPEHPAFLALENGGVQAQRINLGTEIAERDLLLGQILKILKASPLDKVRFLSVMEAGIERWGVHLLPTLEAAHTRMSEPDRGFVRSHLLHVFHTLRRWPEAGRFLPAKLESSAADSDIMDTLLALGRMEEARLVAEVNLRRLQREDCREDSVKTDQVRVVTDYYRHAGRWLDALRIWELTGAGESHWPDAQLGIAEVHAELALAEARSGVTALREYVAANQQHWEEEGRDFEIEPKELIKARETLAQLEQLLASLEQSLPPERRTAYERKTPSSTQKEV